VTGLDPWICPAPERTDGISPRQRANPHGDFKRRLSSRLAADLQEQKRLFPYVNRCASASIKYHNYHHF
jgi:hypothetical protein